MPTSETSQLRGGAWLIEPTDARDVLTPERLTDEHRLIGNTTQQFVEQEVLPELDRLEQHDWTVARRLIRRCGDLGLLGVDVPETTAASTSTRSPRWSSANGWRARRRSAPPSAGRPT